MTDKPMSLKAFWDALEEQLAAYTADELRALVRAFAREVTPTERQAFLTRVRDAPRATVATFKHAVKPETLLKDILALANQVKQKMKNAEYYDDYDDYYEEHDDTPSPYDDFIEPLTALFDRTQAVFDLGDFARARAAYQKLFEIFDLEDDYGRGLDIQDLSTVDANEARARYLRAVYETESSAQRPQVLYEQMRIAEQWFGPPPMLEDIISITRAALPERERFLDEWITFLRQQEDALADLWLREAIRLARGTAGLAELARTEGKKRPLTFLDWFTALEVEGDYQQVLAGVQEALRVLPKNLRLRAAIADHWARAAHTLNQAEEVRAARWEAFRVEPALGRLLDVWESTPSAERCAVMQQAVQHLQTFRPPRADESNVFSDRFDSPIAVNRATLVHACLLAGDWEAAYQLATKEQVLGWSSTESAQTLVVPFFLVVLSGKRPNVLPRNLRELWQAGLEYSSGWSRWNTESVQNRLADRLERIYEEYIPTLTFEPEQQARWLEWCLGVANKRVDAIVSGQHRGSYNKAAMLIGACAETLRARGDPAQADALVRQVRTRFPRHRSFLAELDARCG
ncbi:MAG: hypothetical protein N2559_10590 [Anaerolineae bacterium]|nr:hypothetical protein [Anaerolineae bacterium]